MRRSAQGALAAAVLTPFLVREGEAFTLFGSGSAKPVVLDLTKDEYTLLRETGGAIKIPNPFGRKPLIVRRTSETGVAAYSSACTHWGCEVPLPVNDVIKCPCHESIFDGSGNWIQGPAGKNLKHYPAVLSKTTITIGPETK